MSADLTLVMLAVGGTVALCGAAHLLGFNKSSIIADPATAEGYVVDYAPSSVPKMSVVASDSQSALVVSTQNNLFLVTMLGDSPVVRQLTQIDITPIDGGNVTINVRDLGFPTLIFSAQASALNPILQAFNQGRLQ